MKRLAPIISAALVSSALSSSIYSEESLDADTKTDTMTAKEAARIIAEAGFPKKDVMTVTCLAEHESHFKVTAVNKNRNHTHDYGFLQINSIWTKKEGCNLTAKQLFDPNQNAQCAYKIYKTQGLTAWSTYKTFHNTCRSYRIKGFQFSEYFTNNKINNTEV